jgi:methylthioribose-1-phosphate isomerase
MAAQNLLPRTLQVVVAQQFEDATEVAKRQLVRLPVPHVADLAELNVLLLGGCRQDQHQMVAVRRYVRQRKQELGQTRRETFIPQGFQTERSKLRSCSSSREAA